MPSSPHSHRRWLDAALGLAVVLFQLPFMADSATLAASPLEWLIWPSSLLAGVAVAIRRASPRWGLALAALSAALQMAAWWPPSLVNLAQLIVVFSCAAGPSRRLRWVALAAAVAGAAVGGIYTFFYSEHNAAEEGRGLLVGGIAGGVYLLALGLAWALGYARHLVLRSREAQVARRIAEVEGAHDRELAASERERGRIAREMHDVLAHSLVVIATLSDGARRAIPSAPDEAEATMRTIGEVSRDALADVRRLLAELRHEQASGPAASFAERGELVERFAELGLRIRRGAEGEERPLTPGASLAAYRAVQEGLTNALRHGDARQPVELVERWSDEGLEIRVSNRCREGGADGAGAFPSGGHGLIGLRERVLLEAGRFAAGRAGDEFRLDVALPVGQAERVGPRILEPHEEGEAR